MSLYVMLAYAHSTKPWYTYSCWCAAQQVPECYKGPVLRHVHHATVRLEELCGQLLKRFQGRWVPGEGALASRAGAPAACRVIAALELPEAPGARCAGPGGGVLCDSEAERLMRASKVERSGRCYTRGLCALRRRARRLPASSLRWGRQRPVVCAWYEG